MQNFEGIGDEVAANASWSLHSLADDDGWSWGLDPVEQNEPSATELVDLGRCEEALHRLGGGGVSSEARAEFFAHASLIACVLQASGVGYDAFLALSRDFRAQLYEYSDAVCVLVRDGGISLKDLCTLELDERWKLYTYPSAMRLLIEIADLDWSSFSELPLRSELCEHLHEVLWLLQKTGCSLKGILVMPPFLRFGLYAAVSPFVEPSRTNARPHLPRPVRPGHFSLFTNIFQLLDGQGISPIPFMIRHPEIFFVDFKPEEYAEVCMDRGQLLTCRVDTRKKFERFLRMCEMSDDSFWARPESFRSDLCQYAPEVIMFLAKSGVWGLLVEGALCSPSELLVFVSKTHMPLPMFFKLPPDLCRRVYASRHEVLSLLQDKKHAWFMTKALLGKIVFPAHSAFFPQRLAPEPSGIFYQIKKIFVSQIAGLKLLPPDYVVEADTMESLTSLRQTIFEMRKNAVVLCQARRNSSLFNAPPSQPSLGELPDMLQLKILEWTGYDRRDESILASYCYEQERVSRGKQM